MNTLVILLLILALVILLILAKISHSRIVPLVDEATIDERIRTYTAGD